MTDFKRIFALVVGLMACLVAALFAVYFHYGVATLGILMFTLMSGILFFILCAIIAMSISCHDK
jgi:membrane protease YdiL (CAAX protease family)